ncbi:DDE-type integrase/transposase/recombinase [Enterococcus faecalis]|nr:DDE-type integrase/transposase/recombinase [Enterococcus faecalis]MBW4167499.1 DDE-type integrase/transposase/recombinase [Enterococcus faecalis]CAG4707492.1 Uncharacterised protein [Enterococcus faecalis]HAP3438645.1 DDE-type integrase/transposase/recombinase [Enterococcus faecalis]HAP3438900.1 DDE-type integrase/transposase/recombinase [Enterococcus faecalis]
MKPILKKHYVWIIIDSCEKIILTYQVYDNRSIDTCILAMNMTLRNSKCFLVKHYTIKINFALNNNYHKI